VPLVPHSDELGALACALARATRAFLGTGLALPTSAPTSDVLCRRPSTGAATPATASATIAPHEAGHGVTRTPRATAPSPGLGTKACAPGTSATLSAPTTRIAGAHRPSRELGPLHPYPCASTYATARVYRALAPPKLHRQHFARSSYRCGTRLTGSCNSIFKDEHPSLHRLLRPCGQSELRTSRRSAHFGYQIRARVSAFSSDPNPAPAASDAPGPLPRRRVNDTGLKCGLGTPSSRNAAASPPLAVTTRRLSPADRAVSRNRRRARTSTTTLTDFCNRYKARAHWRTITTRRSAAFHERRRCALRRSGDAKIAPTALALSQRRARHGSRLCYQN
jgi:hypothetical protein